jgi:hypothetical protein
MKKKDIIVIVICFLVIAGSLFFILTGFKAKPVEQKSQNKETIEFTGNIDKDSIEKLKSRRDFGTPPMDNIGRDNPFASL